ncbi:MAG: DMT family transporter [Pseudomonadota bacterium]|nr:DMT family transporter [Pseudomonadota bacterium]
MTGLLLCQLLLWLAVLRRSELSFAQPLTSLSYVGVGLLSWLWLGEVLQPRTLLSVGLILAGVMLVSRSAPRRDRATAAPERASGSP